MNISQNTSYFFTEKTTTYIYNSRLNQQLDDLMQEITLLKTQLRLSGTTLVLDRLFSTTGPEPLGTLNPTEEVPSTIIGYWADIRSEDGQVLYRRFINNVIPLNLQHTCTFWKLGKQNLMRFKFDVPHFINARTIEIYEQSRICKTDKNILKRKHLCIDLQDLAHQTTKELFA